MVPSCRASADFEGDLESGKRVDAIRVWGVADTVSSLLCDIPDCAISSTAKGYWVVRLIAVRQDPFVGIDCVISRHSGVRTTIGMAMLAISRFPISSIVAAAKVVKRCMVMKKTLKSVKFMIGRLVLCGKNLVPNA
jgi:hypothetical protein